MVSYPSADGPTLTVHGGTKDTCATASAAFSALLSKKDAANVTTDIRYPESLTAPLSVGDVIGEITYSVNGEVIGKADITVTEDIPRIGFSELLRRMLTAFSDCGQ